MNFSQTLFHRDYHRQLLTLALPMILSNITIPLLGLVDTAVIGHLAHAYYLGGVAVGSTIITLIFWLLGFLRMSTTGLVAQAVGAEDAPQQIKLLLRGLAIAVLLGGGVIAVQSPIFTTALMFTDASDAVQTQAQYYFSVRIWSAPFALMNLVLLGWLLGKKLPRAAMWQLIGANVVNIVLDVVFVLGLEWGVKGAALASVIADVTGFAIALMMVNKVLLELVGQPLAGLLRQTSFRGAMQLIKLNRDIFIRSLCLQFAFAFMTFQAASLGDITVAANAVLLNLLLLISYALDGIAYYAEVEVGSAIGARDTPRRRLAVTIAWGWSAVFSLIFMVVFFGAGEWIIAGLTGIEAVRETAMQYLPWLVAMPLMAFSSYLFDGVYIGAAKGEVMRNSMIFSTFVVFFPLWWCLDGTGNHALWAAMSAFMLARSVSLGIHYRYYFE